MIRNPFYCVKDATGTYVVNYCPECGRENRVKVSDNEMAKLTDPECMELIQNILPHHSREDRETIITGYCVECWNKMFGLPLGHPAWDDDEEEDEEDGDD